MPDMSMCNSTVCAIRSNCERNWDSGVHEPDREAKVQAWIPQNQLSGVGHHAGAKATDCTWYLAVSKEPVITVVTRDAYGAKHREFRQ